MFYPDFVFPPINLWNFPKQNRDYMKHTTAADIRARNLQLNPRKRNTNPNSRIVVEPARGVGAALQGEQILMNIYRRHGGRG